MLETDKQLNQRKIEPIPILIGLLVLAGIGAFGYFQWKAAEERANYQPVLTEEAKAYLGKLDLGQVEMAAKESALEQTLVEITGKITNLGDKTIRSAQINCVFFDVNGMELHRVPAAIVRTRQGPLRAGEQREFRLAFDAIPDGWNQIMPSLYISEIVFD